MYHERFISHSPYKIKARDKHGARLMPLGTLQQRTVYAMLKLFWNARFSLHETPSLKVNYYDKKSQNLQEIDASVL